MKIPLSISAALLLIAGCGGGGGNELRDAQFRVINLSPGTSIDVSADDSVAVREVDYLEDGTRFVSKDGDTYDFFVRENGTTADLVAEAVSLVDDQDYLYVTLGLKEFGDEPLKRLRGALLNFDRRRPNGTKARIIAVHAYVQAAGSQTPSVQFRGPGDSPQVATGVVPFGGAALLELDAGPQTLEIRPEGGEGALTTSTTTFLPGRIYVAAFTGIEGGTGDQAPALRFFEIETRD